MRPTAGTQCIRCGEVLRAKLTQTHQKDHLVGNDVEIGWDAFLRGYIPDTWVQGQEQYYRAQGFDPKKKTGTGFANKFHGLLDGD